MSTITSKIELNVELDENRVPEKLKWSAEDGGVKNEEVSVGSPAVDLFFFFITRRGLIFECIN